MLNDTEKLIKFSQNLTNNHKIDLALIFLDHHLKMNLNDRKALQLKAELCFLSAQYYMNTGEYLLVRTNLINYYDIIEPNSANEYIIFARFLFELKYYKDSIKYSLLALKLDDKNEIAKALAISARKCLESDFFYSLFYCSSKSKLNLLFAFPF